MKEKEKKKLLTQLRRYITAAENIANTLIGEEYPHSYNQDKLSSVKREMTSCLTALDYVKYN